MAVRNIVTLPEPVLRGKARKVSDFGQELQNLIDEGKYKIVVNFNELSYISSAGLGVFMGFIETIREQEGDIKLSSMSPKIFRVFDLLGFPTLYDILDTDEEAKTKFA